MVKKNKKKLSFFNEAFPVVLIENPQFRIFRVPGVTFCGAGLWRRCQIEPNFRIGPNKIFQRIIRSVFKGSKTIKIFCMLDLFYNF